MVKVFLQGDAAAEELGGGLERATLDDLADRTVAADKILVF